MNSLLRELIVEGNIKINLEDDIQTKAVVTHDGKVRL